MQGPAQEESDHNAAGAVDTTPHPETKENIITTASPLSRHEHEDSSLSLPPLPDRDDSALVSSYLQPSSETGDVHRQNNQTILEEREMRKKLMDMESSFLPEPSTIGIASGDPHAGADDTYLVGIVERSGEASFDSEYSSINVPQITTQGKEQDDRHDTNGPDEATPAGVQDRDGINTSSLETLTSSPTAEAAARTVSRILSIASSRSQEGDKTAEISEPGAGKDTRLTPKRSRRNLSPAVFGATQPHEDQLDDQDGTRDSGTPSNQKRTRPKYLSSRQSSHRFSTSSATSTNTDTTASDATLGADYALQSGGAVPGNAPASRKDLSRSISLGSMASGVSGFSDDHILEKRAISGVTDGGLHTLDEEDPVSPPHKTDNQDRGPMTPRAAPRDLALPTDAVIAEHIQDIQVPGTFARQFREKFARSMSPDKRGAAPTPGFGRTGKNMTLKEQSSTIDRLSKENFDLKMRIHFLNEALNKRSEEGIKEMISENVELKSDKLKLQKENQGLRRTIRDLEKKVKDQQSDKGSTVHQDPEAEGDEDRNGAEEEEILFLRERLEVYEVEIERLRSESLARESDKRRLAEIVKSLGDGRPVGSEAGAREERVSLQKSDMMLQGLR